MTADHPTREERYAATVLPFIRKVCTCHLFSSDREPHNVGCETLVNAHRLAAALVAADPAPAQPDAGKGRYEACVMDAEGNCRRWTHNHPPTQPDAALSGDSGSTEATEISTEPGAALSDSEDRDEFCDTLGVLLADALEALGVEDVNMSDGWALADTVFCAGYRLAARAAQPIPAPEVSRGVAEHHVHEWQVEYLPDPMSAGSVVRSGDLRCSCGETVRDALPADDGADCCRERTTAGGCGCGGGS